MAQNPEQSTLGLRAICLISEFSKPYKWWKEHPTPSAQAMFESDLIQNFWGDAFEVTIPYEYDYEDWEDFKDLDYLQAYEPMCGVSDMFSLSLYEWLKDQLILRSSTSSFRQ